jgi:hemerythrin
MQISWTPSLATGVAEVDRQHKELFARVNQLSEAMRQGKGRAEIGQTLDFLGQYVVRHFTEEEKYMDELRCPAAAANRAAHQEFLATFKTLRKRFDDDGGSTTLVLEISDTLFDWLTKHIRAIDTQLNQCTANV